MLLSLSRKNVKNVKIMRFLNIKQIQTLPRSLPCRAQHGTDRASTVPPHHTAVPTTPNTNTLRLAYIPILHTSKQLIIYVQFNNFLTKENKNINF